TLAVVVYIKPDRTVRSTDLPYTTLFRSGHQVAVEEHRHGAAGGGVPQGHPLLLVDVEQGPGPRIDPVGEVDLVHLRQLHRLGLQAEEGPGNGDGRDLGRGDVLGEHIGRDAVDAGGPRVREGHRPVPGRD